MSDTKLLPLGSVIVLKGSTKKMLIIARMIAAPVKGDLYRFDYGACLYPEGVVGENLIYFNHEDIFKIVQEGYTNDENELMLENIAAVQKVLQPTDMSLKAELPE